MSKQLILVNKGGGTKGLLNWSSRVAKSGKELLIACEVHAGGPA